MSDEVKDNDKVLLLNDFEIPSSFMVGGMTITVEFNDSECEDHEVVGLAQYQKNKILLKGNNANKPRPKDDIERVFFHELFHYIFMFAGEEKLAKDEVKIDRLALLGHQAFKTMQYNHKNQTK